MYLRPSSDASRNAYESLANSVEHSGNLEVPFSEEPKRTSRESMILKQIWNLLLVLAFILAAVLGFAAGVLSTRGIADLRRSDTAPRIALTLVQQESIYSSPFSREPSRARGQAQSQSQFGMG